MKKLILSLVLVFLLPTSAARIYSYYEDTNNLHITTESSHILLTQDMETEKGKHLVPKGAILGVDDVEEIVFTYTVFVQKDIEIYYHVYNIEIDNKLASSEISDIFIFEFEQHKIEFDGLQTKLLEEAQEGYYLEITLTLSMDFPTEEQYFLISGQPLSFDISFESNY